MTSNNSLAWKLTLQKQKECGLAFGKVTPKLLLVFAGLETQKKALGIFFSYDSNKANELNFVEKIRNLEKTLNSWKRRNLTLYGKVNIVKTLGLSKLIYSASVLVIPEQQINEINSLIQNFI